MSNKTKKMLKYKVVVKDLTKYKNITFVQHKIQNNTKYKTNSETTFSKTLKTIGMKCKLYTQQ